MRDDFFVGMLGGAFLMFVVSAMPAAIPRYTPFVPPPTDLPAIKGDKLPMRPLASFSQYGFCWPHHGCEDV